MNNKKFITLLMLVLVSIIIFCSCASAVDQKSIDRVNEALDKAMTLKAQHMKGTIDIKMSAAGQNIDMGINFDAKLTSSEDMEMSMSMTGFMSMDMSIYGTGGKYYMLMPMLSDKYIDVSSQYDQQSSNTFVDMSMFDFDAYATSMNTSEDSSTGKLKVDVKLNNEQMKNLIKKVYAEQNKGSDTLSGQSSTNLQMLESMNIDSAQYTIYIDKDNNISRFELTAKISMDVSGQNVKMEMTASYDILETGDAVKVELPDIQPDDVISYEEVLGGVS